MTAAHGLKLKFHLLCLLGDNDGLLARQTPPLSSVAFGASL